jgi:hypothetical protein
VTYPLPTTMQIDFPSRHSHAIIDDGRNSSRLVSDYDGSHRRASPKLTHERSATEYTSTRKLGGGGDRVRNSSKLSSDTVLYFKMYPFDSGPGVSQTYQEPVSGRGSSTYSPTSGQYQSSEYQSPTRRVVINSSEPFTTYTSSVSPRVTTRIDPVRPRSPVYTFHVTAGDPQTRSSIPSSSRSESVQEQRFSEDHREVHHRRSSPTTGEQSSHEVEHHRSGSPSLRIDEDRFRSTASLGRQSQSPSTTTTGPSSSRNVEVRESSRRVGRGGTINKP